MKKSKIVFWLIIIAVVGLIVWENMEFFAKTQSFTLNTYLADPYVSPPLPHGVWFLACFVIGFLIAYFSSLMESFKAKKTIKELLAKADSHRDIIAQLRRALEAKEQPAQATVVDTPAAEPEPPIDVESRKD